MEGDEEEDITPTDIIMLLVIQTQIQRENRAQQLVKVLSEGHAVGGMAQRVVVAASLFHRTASQEAVQEAV